jgi:hypothetical protein
MQRRSSVMFGRVCRHEPFSEVYLVICCVLFITRNKNPLMGIYVENLVASSEEEVVPTLVKLTNHWISQWFMQAIHSQT